jgi:hypothetical protein
VSRLPLLKPGLYHGPAGGLGASSAALTPNRLYVTPWDVPRPTAFDRIGSEVTGAVASALLRWGVYADDGYGYPGALVFDTGTVDASATGWKFATQSFSAGARRYHLAVVGQGAAATVRNYANSGTRGLGMGVSDGDSGTGLVTGSGVHVAWYYPGVSGAMPSTFPAIGSSGAGVTNAAPQVWVRAA